VLYAEKLINFFAVNDFAPAAYAYTYLAGAHKQLTNSEERKNAITRGLEALPNNETLLTELGYCLEDAKEIEEALETWHKLIEIAPKSAVPYNRIAM